MYSNVLETDSTILGARYNRGICYLTLNEQAKGISDIRYYLKYVPKDSSRLVLLATAYALDQGHKETIITFQKAINLDFKLNYNDYFNLGSAY